MSKHNELESIDPATLGNVTGGTVSNASSSSDAITTALTEIQQSIASLQSNQSQGGGGSQMMMMMMQMMMQGGFGGFGAQAPAQVAPPQYSWPMPIKPPGY
jgi:hypothetical protein